MQTLTWPSQNPKRFEPQRNRGTEKTTNLKASVTPKIQNPEPVLGEVEASKIQNHCNGYGFRAMNTQVYTWLYSSAENSSEILVDVQTMFISMERRLSRFNPHSELSQLNKAGHTFIASPALFDAVSVALWAAHATGGLFDPTILEDLERAGYDCSFDLMDTRMASPLKASPKPQPGRFLRLNLNRARSIIAKPPSLKLDLGGIGKGWTVDRVTDRLLGLGPFLVNAGGDLYAHGSPPGRAGWEISLPHPQNDDHTLAVLAVTDRAVATSSITRRRWWWGGERMHHLIDPRTGLPADTDLLSVTVIGERVAPAEVFAKVALIIGAREGLAYLNSIPNIEGLLVTNDGRILQTGGLGSYLTHLS